MENHKLILQESVMLLVRQFINLHALYHLSRVRRNTGSIKILNERMKSDDKS
jgi:hypothetical protein